MMVFCETNVSLHHQAQKNTLGGGIKVENSLCYSKGRKLSENARVRVCVRERERVREENFGMEQLQTSGLRTPNGEVFYFHA